MNSQWSKRLVRCGTIAVLMGATALVSGCKSEQKRAACVEGASVECACPGGGKGAQVCTAAGTFGPCDCGAQAAAPEPSSAEAAADPAEEAGREAAADTLSVSRAAFGPFQADTTVDLASLRALFPDHQVTQETAAEEGYEWMEFHIVPAGSDEPALIVIPDEKTGKVASVLGTSPAVRHESGFGIGSTYEEVRAALGEMRCDGGIHQDVHRVVCRREGDADFALQVTFDMGSDALAFKSDLKGPQLEKLEGKKVSRITWVAPKQ